LVFQWSGRAARALVWDNRAVAGRIVVGIDGSDASKEALSWALAEARLRGDTVVAVHAWMTPYTVPAALPGAPMTPVDDGMAEAIRNGAEALLAETVAEAGAAGDVTIEKRVVEGPAATALIEAAKGAELLVVGPRGHGGFTGLLLGSVSDQVVNHAPCPVVIVRAAENDA
jgi:nucleotide-binding universal stress UspA family protein